MKPTQRQPIMFANGNDIVGQVRVIKDSELNDSNKVKEFKSMSITSELNLPWYKGYDSSKYEKTIFGHDEDGNMGTPILFTDKDTKMEHIDYIIKAVNSHEQLVNSLKNALEIIDEYMTGHDKLACEVDIKKAQEVLDSAQKEG